MLEFVNFASRSSELQRVYKSILNGDPDIVWGVFGYEQNTNILNVDSTGNGDLSSFCSKFREDNIQYGLVRFQENPSTPKIVLISWCGPNCPEKTKSVFNAHQKSVAKFFKGCQVQINATSQEEIKPKTLIQKVGCELPQASTRNASVDTTAVKSQKPGNPPASKLEAYKAAVDASNQPRKAPNVAVKSAVVLDTKNSSKEIAPPPLLTPKPTSQEISKHTSSLQAISAFEKFGVRRKITGLLLDDSEVSEDSTVTTNLQEKKPADREVREKEIQNIMELRKKKIIEPPTTLSNDVKSADSTSAVTQKSKVVESAGVLKKSESFKNNREENLKKSQSFRGLKDDKMELKKSQSFKGLNDDNLEFTQVDTKQNEVQKVRQEVEVRSTGEEDNAEIWLKQKQEAQKRKQLAEGENLKQQDKNKKEYELHKQEDRKNEDIERMKKEKEKKKDEEARKVKEREEAELLKKKDEEARKAKEREEAELHKRKEEQRIKELQMREEEEKKALQEKEKKEREKKAEEEKMRKEKEEKEKERIQKKKIEEERLETQKRAQKEEEARQNKLKEEKERAEAAEASRQKADEERRLNEEREKMEIQKKEKLIREQKEEEERQRLRKEKEDKEKQVLELRRQQEEKELIRLEEQRKNEEERAKEEERKEQAKLQAEKSRKTSVDVKEEKETLKGINQALVLYSYSPGEENELQLIEGEILYEIQKVDKGWWFGKNVEGQSGYFPSNYVKEVTKSFQNLKLLDNLMEATSDVIKASKFDPTNPTTESLGKCAIALYNYQKAEENELGLEEGVVVTRIQCITKDWWQGFKGLTEDFGLFPANYIKSLEGHEIEAFISRATSELKEITAIALYDYEAKEENEISLRVGELITGIMKIDEGWWRGTTQNGNVTGIFPANYVQEQL